MTPWQIEGRELINCNCSYGCPCQFNALPSQGFCQAMGGIAIDRGHYGEVRLDGLKLAVEQSPQLILMDIQLPGMDGITAMKQLKAEPKTKSIPVIAITASAMTHNRTTMLAEGFDGYQTKPITLKDFLGEIERVLASQAKQ